MSKGKRLKRYHESIFFPDWGQEALKSYTEQVTAARSVSFSIHAVRKIIEIAFDFGKNFLPFLIRTVRRGSLDVEKVFEFYATDGIVKKACFRHSFDNFPVDLVIVISADGVVITVFVINKGDTHSTLDAELYEKG